jgi:hypothetical protein
MRVPVTGAPGQVHLAGAAAAAATSRAGSGAARP